jgi:hypothetical protein
MFGLFKKKTPPGDPTVRSTLFGDMPLELWGVDNDDSEPWSSFAGVRVFLERNDSGEAIGALRKILGTPGLESRHYLEAWHVLRGLGVRPASAEGRHVLGVVVEFGMPRGLDLLAAYDDLSARYYNFSGAAVVWEHPDESPDPPIRAVLAGPHVWSSADERLGHRSKGQSHDGQRDPTRAGIDCEDSNSEGECLTGR